MPAPQGHRLYRLDLGGSTPGLAGGGSSGRRAGGARVPLPEGTSSARRGRSAPPGGGGAGRSGRLVSRAKRKFDAARLDNPRDVSYTPRSARSSSRSLKTK